MHLQCVSYIEKLVNLLIISNLISVSIIKKVKKDKSNISFANQYFKKS